MAATKLVTIGTPLGWVTVIATEGRRCDYRLGGRRTQKKLALDLVRHGPVLMESSPAGNIRARGNVIVAVTAAQRSDLAALASRAREDLALLWDRDTPAFATIYTDGSVSGDGRTAGWSCYLSPNHYAAGEAARADAHTAELQAVLNAADTAGRIPGPVTIRCDRQGLVGAIQRRAKPKRGDAAETAMFERLYDLIASGTITVEWVRAHSTSVGNRRADTLAGLAANRRWDAVAQTERTWRHSDGHVRALRRLRAAEQRAAA